MLSKWICWHHDHSRLWLPAASISSDDSHTDAETKLLHFADAISKCIFLDDSIWISLKISLKFVPKHRINKIPALVQIMVGTDQATRHYLNQWWSVYWRIYASRCGCNLYLKIFKLIWRTYISSISCTIALRWMLQNIIAGKSTLL